MIQELPFQITYSENQGQTGIRQWLLDHNDNLMAFMRIICRSHWPGITDSIPIQVNAIPAFKNTVIQRDDSSPRTYETLGDLPQIGKVQVTAHYALHRMTNCWPTAIPKPWHPVGTTLSLEVRGAGQALLISPAGMNAAAFETMTCTPGTEAINRAVGTRIMVPVTEYHVSCDRMTRAQVNAAFAIRDWDEYQGTVNLTFFNKHYGLLGAPHGTLLFDGYSIKETFVCDVDEPRRYCLTAHFKQRIILTSSGQFMRDEENRPVGWNHDFINKKNKLWGWTFINMRRGTECEPRYSFVDFKDLFGDSKKQGCECPDSDATELKDCDLCDLPESQAGSECGSVGEYDPNIESIDHTDSSAPPEPSPSSSSLPECQEWRPPAGPVFPG